MGVSNMFGIKEYKEYYQVGFVEGDDFIDHVAILILDLNEILEGKWERSFIPYIGWKDTINDWISKCFEFDSLSNTSQLKNINSKWLYHQEYDVKMKIVELDGKFRLRLGDTQQGIDEEEKDCALYDLSDFSQRAAGGIHRLQQGDIFRALSRIYTAEMYMRFQRQSEEYKQLQNNLAFMKKFIRECIGGNNV